MENEEDKLSSAEIDRQKNQETDEIEHTMNFVTIDMDT